MRSKNFADHLEERTDSQKIAQLKLQAQLEQEALESLQHDIAAALVQHMETHGLGFNDLSRGLAISPSQTAKILKRKANLTCASLAHIAAFLGKKPHLIFN